MKRVAIAVAVAMVHTSGVFAQTGSADAQPHLDPPPGAVGYISRPYGTNSVDLTVRDASGRRPIVVPTGLDVRDAEFDVDASRLALLAPSPTSVGELYIAQPDGTSPVLVTGTTDLGLLDIEWAPGSEDTLFGVTFPRGPAAPTLLRIVLKPDGSASVSVIAALSVDELFVVRPAPSGDAVAVSGSTSGRLKTFVVDVRDGHVREVPHSLAFSWGVPGWSPDGARLLFTKPPTRREEPTRVQSLDVATLSVVSDVATLAGADAFGGLTGEFDALQRPLVLVRLLTAQIILQAVDLVHGTTTTMAVLPMYERYVADITTAPGLPWSEGSCAGYTPTIRGTSGDDVIRGTAGRDVILAGGGDDVVDGLGGDDVVCGEGGNDVVRGGSGDDRLYGDAGDDQIHGDDGDDLIGTSDGDDRVWGGPGSDRITTGPGDDRIWAGDGDDSVRGGFGADVVDLGGGDDEYAGGRLGIDIITAGLGDDVVKIADESTVDLGPGEDFAYNYGGVHHRFPGTSVNGGAGDDRIEVTNALMSDGGPGDDEISWAFAARGGEGDDDLSYVVLVDAGPGDDVVDWALRVTAGPGDDIVKGGAPRGVGTTQLDGGDGNDVITGRAGADSIDGGPGDDVLVGLGGDDTIIGASGNDKLSGGDGNDTLDGGPGHDLCHLSPDPAALRSCEVTYPRTS